MGDFGWDLPPGVTDSMIPGNTPEDHEWEALYEWLEHYAAKEGLTPYEIRRMIEMPTGDKDDHSTNDE